jgi:hypothetical protein
VSRRMTPNKTVVLRVLCALRLHHSRRSTLAWSPEWTCTACPVPTCTNPSLHLTGTRRGKQPKNVIFSVRSLTQNGLMSSFLPKPKNSLPKPADDKKVPETTNLSNIQVENNDKKVCTCSLVLRNDSHFLRKKFTVKTRFKKDLSKTAHIYSDWTNIDSYS